MVRSFELVEGRLRRVGESSSLAEASKALPGGAYTTLRTYGRNRTLRLDRHVQRLQESANQMGAPAFELSVIEVRQAIALGLEVTGHPESRIRLTWAPPRLFVSVEPFEPPPESLYRDGAWCVSVPLRRDNPHAKDSRFVATAADVFERLPAGAHEGLIVGRDGALLEGLSSNFFALCRGALHTEEELVLPGVTRSLVLDLAHELLPVSLVAVRLEELPQVSEAFLTSVSRGIVPVVRIDERAIGDGRSGLVTRELMRRFAEAVEREATPV